MILPLRYSIGKEMKKFVKLMRSSRVVSQNLNLSRVFMLSLHFFPGLIKMQLCLYLKHTGLAVGIWENDHRIS